MKEYDTPVEGQYRMLTPDFKGGFKCVVLEVLVVGETAKEYGIKARVSIRGRKPMETLSVHKKSVKLRTELGEPKRVYDYSGAFWNA